MYATILSLILSFIVGAVVWLTAGPRFKLDEDARQNEILNVLAYFGIAFPFCFAIVFFAIEKL